MVETDLPTILPPAEDPSSPTDKKSKKHRKDVRENDERKRKYYSFDFLKDLSSTSLADGKMATTTIALTTDEISTTPDKKTMRKRVKHFLKKHKSVSGTPMKPESKLSKIQKSMMSKQHQYQPIPLIEVVCDSFAHIR